MKFPTSCNIRKIGEWGKPSFGQNKNALKDGPRRVLLQSGERKMRERREREREREERERKREREEDRQT